MGLYLFSAGTNRAVIDFMSHCGLSSSYTTILEAHKFLSKDLIKKAAKLASGPHMLGFDNEQISMSTHISQRPGAIPAVRSFTAGILYALRNATLGACVLQPILDRRKNCPIITYKNHIQLTRCQRSSFHRHLVLDVMDILIKNTPGFQTDAYTQLIKHEKHRPPPEGHKTEEFILPTLEIDESTTIGVLSYFEVIYNKILKVSEALLNCLAIPTVNDQLTNSRICGSQVERRGDISPTRRVDNFQCGIGMFHADMNLGWKIHTVHEGSPDVPGSLSFWQAFLGTKRIGTARPDYYTLKTHHMDILYGNILHSWSKKTGHDDLENYAKTNPLPSELENTAAEILNDYISDEALSDCKSKKDNLFYNVVLLNRDLLYLYEFQAAISSGDFGRLELMLGTLTRMFNGAGARNYSTEFLHLIQNLKISWPEPFA